MLYEVITNDARASWMAVRIKELLDDRDTLVWDKAAKETRPIRGGDVAVLCPTHVLVNTYAETLRTLGILTRIEKGGWYASSEVRIVCHALSWLADADDSYNFV